MKWLAQENYFLCSYSQSNKLTFSAVDDIVDHCLGGPMFYPPSTFDNPLCASLLWTIWNDKVFTLAEENSDVSFSIINEFRTTVETT